MAQQRAAASIQKVARRKGAANQETEPPGEATLQQGATGDFCTPCLESEADEMSWVHVAAAELIQTAAKKKRGLARQAAAEAERAELAVAKAVEGAKEAHGREQALRGVAGATCWQLRGAELRHWLLQWLEARRLLWSALLLLSVVVAAAASAAAYATAAGTAEVEAPPKARGAAQGAALLVERLKQLPGGVASLGKTLLHRR